MSTQNKFQRSRCARLVKLLFVVALLSLPLLNALGQSAVDATTPPGQSPGAPAGSYPLGGFDTVNLFNGHLNFRLPLLQVNGRGGVSFASALPIEQRWTVDHDSFGPYHFPNYNWWTGLRPGYGPGVLQGRQMSEGCPEGPGNTEGTTRLTFTASDGTEYELRDQIYGGQRASSFCNPFDPQAPGTSRGTTFVTADGSAATFISDSTIYDHTYTPSGPRIITPSGYLMLRDGTRFRIDNGLVTWLRDGNGNKISFTYEGSWLSWRITSATDSLNRQITYQYNFSDPIYGVCDRIIFKGFGGAQRIIRIVRASLSNALIPGESPATYQSLFPTLNGSSSTNHDPDLVSVVWLPDEVRNYQFRYNRYGELCRVDLPTGGRFEYSWTEFAQGMGFQPEINRRVTERRTYTESGALATRSTYGGYESDGFGTQGNVQADHLDFAGGLLSREKHYFHGHPFSYTTAGQFDLPNPTEGREFKTEFINTNGTTVLRRIDNTWTTCGTLAGTNINPCVTQTVSTLEPATTNLVSKLTFSYDTYTNQTDVYEYGFGTGSAGSLVRRQHKEYLTTNPVNGTNYATTSTIHLRSLPKLIQVFDAAGVQRTRSEYEYDNYATDANHASLVDRSNISGLDPSFTTSYLTRGNPTATTVSLINTSGSVTSSIYSYQHYDIAGNVVKAIDLRGNTTRFWFTNATASLDDGTPDSFGSPDGEARTTTPPIELGSVSRYAYAFPVRVTNALAHNVYAQRDFYVGRSVDVEDPNGVVSSSYTDNDLLDRPKRIIQAANHSSVKIQTLFNYDDTNRLITTARDQNTFGDGLLVSATVYDGLGRTRETRRYEGGTNYIVAQMQYDALNRPFKTSNPFRPWQSETAVWTTQAFDALGRVISVTTPDNAIVSTTYSGNSVTVTDQAGKARKSVTDALGRLIELYEDPSGMNYETAYTYDVLDNLVKVTQGTQQRFFMYDSLKRLIRARNPEQGTLTTLNLSDPLTGNSAWSIGYEYDANSNLTQKTDARGVVSIYAYDALNRNTTVDYSDTSSINPDVKRFYDGATKGIGRFWYHYTGGDFSTGSNVDRMLIDSYDALGRPTQQRQMFKLDGTWSAPYQTSRTYNRAGGVLTQAYPSGHSVTYNYDSAGRVADKDAENLAFTGNLGDGQPRTYASGNTYSPWGSLSMEKFDTETALYHKLQYNIRGQLWDVRVATGSDVNGSWNRGALQFFYDGTYGSGTSGPDNNGNVLKSKHYVPLDESSSTWAIHDQVYSYDALNRLSSVAESFLSSSQSQTPQSLQSYNYDRWGNRTINPASWGTGINTKQFTVDPTGTNRLTVPTGQTGVMTYDDAGNLIMDTYTGAGTRTYDAENRMTSAADNTGQTSRYTYDADGRRTRRQVSGGQEQWQIYGFDGELLAEYPANNAANQPLKEYGYRNGQLLLTAEPATTPPTNVALASDGATATASSSYSGFAATGAINGDRKGLFVWQDGYWSTASAGFPAWLEVQFNGSKTISEINVVTVQDNYNAPVEPTESMTFTNGGLTSYEVQYWTGSTWAAIPGGSISGNNKVWRKFTFAAVTTTKIRIWATGSPDNFSRLTEVEAWTGPSPAPRYNLALGATATASSNWNGWPASSTVNGDRKSLNSGTDGGWVDAGPANTFPDWLQVDLGSNKTINEISVFTLQDNYAAPAEPTESMSFTQWGLTGYEVQYWDGSNWITVPNGSVTGNNKVWRKFTFSPISTSKIRVLTNASADGYSRLTEVEAYGPADPNSGNGIRWLVPDQLGTPRIIIDQTGRLENVKRHDYLPFGEELFADSGGRAVTPGYAGDRVRQQFTQKERDVETGLDYFGARYHASVQGRFTSVDPMRLKQQHLSNPQDLNRYSYVANNPLAYFDPDGMEKIKVIIRTFIPQKTVTAPGGVTVSRGTQPIPAGRTFQGDDRKVGEPGTFRTQQIITIETDRGKNGGCSSCPFISSEAQSGTSRELFAGGQFKEANADVSRVNGAAIYTAAGSDHITVTATGRAADPLVAGAPDVKYDLHISLAYDKNGDLWAQIDGSHTEFPGIEIFIQRPEGKDTSGQLIKGYNPDDEGRGILSIYLSDEISGSKKVKP